MKPLGTPLLLLLAAVALAVSILTDMLLVDSGTISAPWISLLLSAAIGITALALAWRVRAHVKDPSGHRIDPLLAARIAVFAQATQMYGALLTGWSAGGLLHEATLSRYRGTTASLWLVLAGAVLGVLVAVAGRVAENWCRRPPGGEEGEGPSGYDAPGPHEAPEGGGLARDHGERERGR